MLLLLIYELFLQSFIGKKVQIFLPSSVFYINLFLGHFVVENV